MAEDRRTIMQKLYDTNSAMYVLGYVMEQPRILRGEKYYLSVNDFVKPVHQVIFGAAYNLAQSGAESLQPQDIDFYLAQYNEQYKIFSDNQGLNLVTQLNESNFGRDEAQFNLHYERLKKFTVLRDLERSGVDTTVIYDRNADFFDQEKEMRKLEEMTLTGIIDQFRVRLANIEKVNINKTDQYFQNASMGLRELVKTFKENPDVGSALEGDLMNYITRGARPGKLYLISAPSGGGKSRTMVSNACRMAFPRIENGKVVMGDLQKVLYIATEQLPDEIQTMILAYVSGVNEENILRGNLSPVEESLIEQAIQIIERYEDNFLIDVLPSLSLSELRIKIIEPILNKGVESIFFDYIFIPTDEEGTMMRRDLRADQLLMLSSNALKEIAAMYNVFIMTATQVNGTWEGKFVRNQNMIRDSKAIADKVDVGMVAVRCMDDEYMQVETYFKQLGLAKPNMVIDIYKNRRGSLTGVKLFRYFDYGTCRSKDLLVTTQNFKIDNIHIEQLKYDERIIDLLDFLSGGNVNNE